MDASKKRTDRTVLATLHEDEDTEVVQLTDLRTQVTIDRVAFVVVHTGMVGAALRSRIDADAGAKAQLLKSKLPA